MDQAERLREVQRQIEGPAASLLQAVLADAVKAGIADLALTGAVKIPDDFRPKLEAAMETVYRAAIRQGGGVIVDQFKARLPIETKADEETLFERILQEFMRQYGAQRITQIFEATRAQIVDLIARGYRRGETLRTIEAAIQDAVPQISRLRAHVIARTETHTAAMHATQAVAMTSNRPLVKRWSSVEDHRTRDFGEGDGEAEEFNHRSMHAQVVPVDQPYKVPKLDGTTESLMYPGDPAGSAANVIMCRCTHAFLDPDDLAELQAEGLL